MPKMQRNVQLLSISHSNNLMDFFARINHFFASFFLHFSAFIFFFLFFRIFFGFETKRCSDVHLL